MQDASNELSRAPRVTLASGVVAAVILLSGLILVGWLLRRSGMGLATMAPPAGRVTHVTASTDSTTDVWKRVWRDLPVEAWREAAPAFAIGFEDMGRTHAPTSIELQLEAGVERYTIQPAWKTDEPYFFVKDGLDAARSKRYVPIDPAAFKAACEKLEAAVQQAPKQLSAEERLNALMEEQEKKPRQPTGESTPAAAPEATPAPAESAPAEPVPTQTPAPAAAE